MEIAKELLATIPLSAIAKEKAELLKVQIETMEGRLKFMEDRVKFTEEKSAKLEAENNTLKKENASLQEQIAYSSLTEEFEVRGRIAYRKGDGIPLCPDCKTTLNQIGSKYNCRKCGWEFKDHQTWECATFHPSELNDYE